MIDLFSGKERMNDFRKLAEEYTNMIPEEDKEVASTVSSQHPEEEM